MTHGSLFSGIGGFDLASEWMGWENRFHCEWNEFGQKVLKHYWPKSESYGDITKTDFTIWNGRIDILTGGFPCQPYSSAGRRLGTEDERHLWPEMLRAIREIQPRWVVGENVFGLVNWNDGMVFDEVQADLEAEGYEVQPYVLPAVAVNAPHRRDRIWFVAHRDGIRCGGGDKQPESNQPKEREICANEQQHRNGVRSETTGYDTLNPNSNASRLYKLDISTKPTESESRCGIPYERGNFSGFPTQPPVCGGNDGLPAQLDGIAFSKWRNESIKAYGNAIVPQVAHQIFKSIEAYEITLDIDTQ